MQKKLLGVAGCAALMFGLAACSGEDGTNGVNGLNGADGKDGASCTVKALKKDLGYKILCGGDSVGVLLNGEDGENGASCNVMALKDASKGYKVLCNGDSLGLLLNGTKGADGKDGKDGKDGDDGESCTTSSTDDGVKITCGDKSEVIKDGASCSAKETADKAGKKGLEVSCGGTVVGTIWDGDAGVAGKNGESCTATKVTKDGLDGLEVTCGTTKVGTLWDGKNCASVDNNDGTVTVTCGDADPVTITKAMCGETSYDPADQFCVLGKLYDKCGGKTFTINTQYCDNGVVTDLCSEYKTYRNGSIKWVKDRALKDGEFCWHGMIVEKCDGAEYGDLEFCGKTKDMKKDSVISFNDCPNMELTKNRIKSELTAAFNEIGITIFPVASDEEEEAAEETSLFGDLIGNTLAHHSSAEMEAFTDLFAIAKNSCVDGYNAVKKECGTTEYDQTKEFCDIRDNHIYKFVKNSTQFSRTVRVNILQTRTERYTLTWMAENLAFEYKLPKVIEVKEGEEVVSRSLDVSAGKVSYEEDAYENFEATEGRYYTWNAATGAEDFRNDLTTAQLTALDEKDTVIGACPAGWRLPTREEFQTISDLAADPDTENGFEDLKFNINYLGFYKAGAATDTEKAYFWSSVASGNDYAYGLVVTSKIDSEVKLSNKADAYTIRCVKESIID